jgi:single-stranded-DNA-specific exonuclease
MAIAEAIRPAGPAFGVARSFLGRRWILRKADDDAARALGLALDISPMLARLLAARGVTSEQAIDLLNPTLKRLLPEPLSLKDMDKAVARARAAIERGEKIAVFGDYDVDGSASAALVSDFFSALGRRPRVYIPDRMTEGYGPSPRAMLLLKEEGAGLVITVDCGAAATEALITARDAGLDLVVLDHHTIETLPPAFAQVNPNQPGDTSGLGHLCAAGVTFLFLVALNRDLRESGWYAAKGIKEPDLREAIDLVGLATVCDVVPVHGVNRAFVRTALGHLSSAKRPGLAALAAIAKISAPFTPYHFGFALGPRINAGGRVGRCSLGVELLTAANEADATPLALILDRHNRERQALEAVILEDAMADASTQHNAPFLFASGEGWHSGVVGIIAGRLKERFGRPAFVVGFENGMGRGSARSIPGIDIGALVRAAHEQGILVSGGGHAMAAGFSLPAAGLEPFQAFLAAQFANAGGAIAAANDLLLDCTISASGATLGLAEEIARLGPFGAGNPEPLAVASDVRVAFADVVGKGHVRIRLRGADGGQLGGIAFRAADTALGDGLLHSRGAPLHVAGYLRADEWNGQRRVQIQVEDAAPTEA